MTGLTPENCSLNLKSGSARNRNASSDAIGIALDVMLAGRRCEGSLGRRYQWCRDSGPQEGHKDTESNWIDYVAAESGALQLVPRGRSYEALGDDYGKMLSDGMLPDDEERFDDLMERCGEIETRVKRG